MVLRLVAFVSQIKCATVPSFDPVLSFELVLRTVGFAM
jgi:hypothetical protein